jgi:hypothetical protein
VYYPELTATDSVGSQCMYRDTMSVNACMVYKYHNSSIQFYGSAVKYIHLDYGDGDTAKGFKRTNSRYLEYEPIDNHEYDSVGVYYAIVTVVDTFDNICRDTTTINIDCIAEYDYSYDSTNTVYFTNQSQPIDSLSFLWDLEYLVTDTSRDPIYTYGSSGLIFPRLTVTTADNKTCIVRDTISVNKCELDWRIHKDSLQLFIETFSTSFDSVFWNFGDGFFSNTSKEEVNYPGSVWKSTVSIPHVYQVDSIYQASVRKIDEFGNSCIDTINVVYEP